MDTSTPVSVHEETAAVKSLPSAKSLLIESWDLFAKRWRTFFGIMLLVMLPILILSVPAFFLSMSLVLHKVVIAVIMVALLLVVMYFCVWAYASMIMAVIAASKGETVKVVSMYKASRPHIWALLSVVLLVALIVFGGTILFVIPGLIFAVWYNLSYFVVIDEGKKGMAALRQSKAYVAGRFWPVVGRMAVLLLVGFVFSFLVKLVENAFQYSLPIVGSLINLAFNLAWTSFVVVYAYFLYRSLRNTYAAPKVSATESAS